MLVDLLDENGNKILTVSLDVEDDWTACEVAHELIDSGKVVGAVDFNLL